MKSDDFKKGNLWVQRFRVGGVQGFTKMGVAYNKMTCRCKVGGYAQRVNPSYIGCYHTFSDFQDFADWCVRQVGYEIDWELDKDILVKGNLVYSKDTCCLVPRELNSVLVGRKLQRGATSKGVHYIARLGKYRAALSKYGANTHVGLYGTEEEAFSAYKTAKESYVKEVALSYRGKVDERVIAALLAYKVTHDGN